jgi:hypothetical protein
VSYVLNETVKRDRLDSILGAATAAALRHLHALRATVEAEPAGYIKAGEDMHEAMRITSVSCDDKAPPYIVPTWALNPKFEGSLRDADGKVRRYMLFVVGDPHEHESIEDQFTHSADTVMDAMQACFTHWGSTKSSFDRSFEYRIFDRDTFTCLMECEVADNDPVHSWNWSTPNA